MKLNSDQQSAHEAGGAPGVPLGFSQEPLWLHDQLDPGSIAYNIFGVYRLRGALVLKALRESLEELVRRHESLRTQFASGADGRPVQVVLPWEKIGISWREESVPEPGSSRAEAWLQQRVDDLAAEPFDLRQGPLFRVVLIRLGENDHVLGFFTHHIVVDGWSLGVLWREWSQLYNARLRGQEKALPALTSGPVEWAVRQRKEWQGERLDEELDFWREQLAEPLPRLQLPTDFPRTPEANHRGGQCWFILPPEIYQPFKSLCQKERATPFMGLLTVYLMLLQRYSRQEDLIVGYGSSGRLDESMHGWVGMFVNTLALRMNLEGDPTFRELLRRVRSVALDVFEHQEMPFEKLVEELQPRRVPGENPIFQAGFSFMVAEGDDFHFDGLEAEYFIVHPRGSKFEFMLYLHDRWGGLGGAFEYRSDLFHHATIERMTRLFERLVVGVLADPGLRLSEYGLVGEVDEEVLREWGVSGLREMEWMDWGGEESVMGRVRKWEVEKGVERALVGEGVSVSYGEMMEEVRGLGERLREEGVKEEELVGLCMGRSVEMVEGILGIWESGGAYVPLDPEWPEGRMRQVVKDSGMRVVVSHGKGEGHVGLEGLKEVRMREVKRVRRGEVEEREVPGKRLAYVIYTSGSTGEPKGVGVEHGGLMAYVRAVSARLKLPEGGSYALVSTMAADLGHTVLYGSLAQGGVLHVISEERATHGGALAEYQKREGYEVMKVVPTHLSALEGEGRGVLPKRQLILGGEASSSAWVRELKARGVKVSNHYGPTETTVGVVACEVGEEELESGSGNVVMGKPLGHAKVYVMDGNLKLVPVGVPGELCVGGRAVARGYWGREDLTAEKFVEDPYEKGGRMYRTGDLVRWLENGNLEFLGRIDQQLKVRGYRVEPGEIEAVVRRQEGVREAVVVKRGEVLECHVVPRKSEQAAVAGGWKVGNGMVVAQVNRNETEYIYHEIFEVRAYEQHGVRIRAGDVIVDVGANIGMFSLYACCVGGEVEVHAMEPNPVVFEALRRNAKAYGRGRIHVHGVGMGRESGSAELTFFEGFSLLSGMHAEEEVEKEVVKKYVMNQEQVGEKEVEELLEGRFQARKYEVEVKSLSQWLKEEGVERVDLLKVNVEKSEREVLEGVSEEDWKKIGQVVVEVDVKGNLEPIVELLKRQGFEVEVEQDRLLKGTELCYVYGVRKRRGEERLEIRAMKWEVPTEEELRAEVRKVLPEHMVPEKWGWLEELPRNANGKVDRKRLPELKAKARGSGKEKPRNDQEKAIAKIWEEVLGVKEVGVKDDFFELGGHSLKATQLVSRISDAFHIRFPVKTFFETPTIEGCAVAVESILLQEITAMEESEASRLAGE